MSRDDQRGGWLPIAGGGMSKVALFKTPLPTEAGKSSAEERFEYIIVGQRIHDQKVMGGVWMWGWCGVGLLVWGWCGVVGVG